MKCTDRFFLGGGGNSKVDIQTQVQDFDPKSDLFVAKTFNWPVSGGGVVEKPSLLKIIWIERLQLQVSLVFRHEPETDYRKLKKGFTVLVDLQRPFECLQIFSKRSVKYFCSLTRD